MNNAKSQDVIGASVDRGAITSNAMDVSGHYVAQCFGPDGVLKWEEDFDNLVTTEGKKFLLDTVLIPGSAGTGALANVNMFFRMAYITSGTPVAGDTYATHAGFVELGSGVIAARGSPTFSAATGEPTIKSTSAAVSASIIGTGTVTGVAIVVLNAAAVGNLGVVADTATANAKIYSAGTFPSGAKSVGNLDTLNVTYTSTLT